MIEDKELGLKIAESEEEELWSRFVEVTKENLKRAKQDVILYEKILQMAEKELKNATEKDKNM